MKYDPASVFSQGRKISVLYRPTLEMFHDFEARSEPMVVSGAVDHWKSLSKWTPAYLKEVAGERIVNLSQSIDGMHFDRDNVTKPCLTPLSEYMTMIERGDLKDGSRYAGNISIRDSAPELWRDVEYPIYVQPDDYIPPSLWIGPGGNAVPVHHDATHNLFAQIQGMKTVLLFPPEERKFLYPFSFSHRAFYFTKFNVVEPDLRRFPNLKRARCSVVQLSPGDMLFIPKFWWHSMFGHGFNISLSFWWLPKTKFEWRHPMQELGFQYREFQRIRKNVKNGIRNRLFPDQSFS